MLFPILSDANLRKVPGATYGVSYASSFASSSAPACRLLAVLLPSSSAALRHRATA